MNTPSIAPPDIPAWPCLIPLILIFQLYLSHDVSGHVNIINEDDTVD